MPSPPPTSPAVVAAAESPASTPVDNANPHFAPALLAILAERRPVLLLFSGNDRHRHEFAEKFEERYAAQIERSGGHYTVHLIENANHVLSDKAWVAELLDVASRWLEARRIDG